MSILYNTIHYWLVDHPTINQFEWDASRTPGASPLFLTLAIASYLSVTLVLSRFPRLIPTVSSATIHHASAVQSLLLCLLSAAMVFGTILSVLQQTPPENPTYFMCLPSGRSRGRAHGPTFFWAYMFYMSKILEFVDTLLILLSGSRSRRLSFLHVYHHVMAAVICYTCMARMQSMFFLGVVINGSMHVLMYAYYFLRALGYHPTWKKTVTDCQIVQFWFGYVVAGFMLYLHFTTEGGCSGVLDIAFYAVFNASLLVLFSNFRVKNYGKESQSSNQDSLVKDKQY